MSDGNDLSLRCIWGLVAACCVASVGFVVAFCAAQPNESKPLLKGNLGKQVDGSQDKETSLSISRYATIVANANVDRNIILQTLKTYNMEAKAFIVDKKQKAEQARPLSITRFSYFQVTNEQMTLLREQEINEDMLGTLQELMQNYPRNSLRALATLEEIELACTAFEEHHAKVLNLVEVMLPTLFSSLNEAKLVDDESKTRVMAL